jgi:hypothetical protein
MGGVANAVGNAVGSVVKPVANVVSSVAPIAGVAGNLVGGAGALGGLGIGSAIGNAAGSLAGGGDQGAPAAPQADPRLAALRNKQLQTAQDYRAKLGQTKQEYGDIAAEGIRGDISQGLKGIKQGASSRGLLYSGLRGGEEANLQTGGASRLAGAQKGINESTENQANAYDAAALGQNYQGTQAGFGPSDIAYNAAIRQRQGNLESQKQLGQGLGLLGGTYLGSRQQQPETDNQFISKSNPVQQSYSGIQNTGRYA